MKPNRKQLSYLIIILITILVMFGIFIIFEFKLFESQDQNIESKSLKLDPYEYNELATRQQNNGSWDNDIETTVLVTNALTQNADFINRHKDDVEWEEGNVSLDYIRDTNYNSVESAQNWTQDNYGTNLPLNFQIILNYNNVVLSQSDNSEINNVTNIADQTTEIILSTQMQDGSWNNDVKQTSLSIYVLKQNQDPNEDSIIAGENWLISQQDNGDWGNGSNDIFALLALHNSSFDVSQALERVIAYQFNNGSYGDIETTAWALIALSLYDDPNACDAAKAAREWLRQQQNVSDRDFALISLAEMEYISNAVNRMDASDGIWEGKGPPTIMIIILGIIGSSIIILSILCIRLRDHDVLDGVREKIYDYIKAHPGISQNEIMRSLKLSSSSVRHHLRILERFEYILPHSDGKYIRYYVNKNGYSIYANGNGYKEIISVLRNNTAANIVKYIMKNPNINQRNLANALNLHPSTVHWHTKHLLSSEIIFAKRNGKSVQYQINEPLNLNKLLSLAN